MFHSFQHYTFILFHPWIHHFMVDLRHLSTQAPGRHPPKPVLPGEWDAEEHRPEFCINIWVCSPLSMRDQNAPERAVSFSHTNSWLSIFKQTTWILKVQTRANGKTGRDAGLKLLWCHLRPCCANDTRIFTPKPSLFHCLEHPVFGAQIVETWRLQDFIEKASRGSTRLKLIGLWLEYSERFFPPLDYHLAMQNFRCLILQWRNIHTKRNQPSWFVMFQNLCACHRGDALICTRLHKSELYISLIQEGFP